MLQPPQAGRARPRDACPGRCAGRWPGRYPGHPEWPAQLPTLAGALPQVSGELDLTACPGTDD